MSQKKNTLQCFLNEHDIKRDLFQKIQKTFLKRKYYNVRIIRFKTSKSTPWGKRIAIVKTAIFRGILDAQSESTSQFACEY